MPFYTTWNLYRLFNNWVAFPANLVPRTHYSMLGKLSIEFLAKQNFRLARGACRPPCAKELYDFHIAKPMFTSHVSSTKHALLQPTQRYGFNSVACHNSLHRKLYRVKQFILNRSLTSAFCSRRLTTVRRE